MINKHKLPFEKIYFYSFLLLAFTLPLSRAALSFFTIFLPLVWILEGNFLKKWIKIKSNKTLLTFLFFFLILFLSSLWSENDQKTLHRSLRLLGYFPLLFVIATSLKQKYTQKIISAFLGGMFVSEIIAYGIFFELWHFKNVPPHDPSPFMIHIEYSVFLAFSSILLLNRLIAKHYPLKEKMIYAIFFLTVTGNLFITAGRTGQVALIIGIITMLFLHFRFSFKTIIFFFLIIGGIYTTAFYASSTFQKRVFQTKHSIEKMIQNKNFTTSSGIRVAYWITTFHIVQRNPLLGIGLGDYKAATKKELEHKRYDKGFQKTFMPKHHPHNQFLLIALQTGLLGLGLFFYFIYQYFTMPIKNKEVKELSILFGAIYFTSCLAEPLLIKQFSLMLFILFVGIFSANAYGSLEENNNL